MKAVFDYKIIFRITSLVAMFTNFLKFELETVSNEFTVDTTTFKHWLKFAPKLDVDKTFIEGYRIIKKIKIDLLTGYTLRHYKLR